MDQDVVAELQAIVGADHVRTDRGDVEPYAHDATPLFRAGRTRWSGRARDGGGGGPAPGDRAGHPGGAARRRLEPVRRHRRATGGGIVLVLTRMDRILEVSPDELLAGSRPGVTTAALADAAAAQGLLYAPDPGSRTVSTVGGNVATCAGGLRGLKYGVTRNYVLGHEAVLPTGEVIRTGGRLWKDVAGYDLTRLLTGSEGTLGVITEITVALLPMPATTSTGVAYFPTSPTPAGRSPRSSATGSSRPRWSSSTPSASARSRSTRTSGCGSTPARCCCSATTARPTWSTATSAGSASCAPRTGRSR